MLGFDIDIPPSLAYFETEVAKALLGVTEKV